MVTFEAFPLFGGEVAVAYEVVPQTWWDRVNKRTRVQYAFSFCSPEDRSLHYDLAKGVGIAYARLNILRSGGRRKRKLEGKGFVGEWQFVRPLPTEEELVTMLKVQARRYMPQVWQDRVYGPPGRKVHYFEYTTTGTTTKVA